MNNNEEYSYNSYKPVNYNDDMTEERRQYLIEKENQIKARQRNKKILFNIIKLTIFLLLGFYLYDNFFRPVKIDSRIDKNSIHYVTDLYYSDGRYYETYLDDNEKQFYLHWLNDLKKLNKTSTVDCRTFGYSESDECIEDYYKIFNVILMEHPDLFWYRTTGIKRNFNGNITLEHYLVSTNKVRLYFVEKKLLRKIDKITTEYKDGTDYEKIKNIYNWLGKDKSYSLFHTRKSGTAWSALLTNNSVCAGYAAASQLLFQRMNIESVVVVGNLNNGGHAWNFVQLDDGYYWYDSTVGGSADNDDSWFYNGLLFKNTGKYNVSTINLEDYTFGTKYLNYKN